MSMIPIPQETFRSAMKADTKSRGAAPRVKLADRGGASSPAGLSASTLHKPPMNRWAPLGIVITSFVLWGCVYRLALVLAAAMGWL